MKHEKEMNLKYYHAICEIWGLHGGKESSRGFLGCDAV